MITIISSTIYHECDSNDHDNDDNNNNTNDNDNDNHTDNDNDNNNNNNSNNGNQAPGIRPGAWHYHIKYYYHITTDRNTITKC